MNSTEQIWWADAVDSRLTFTLRHLVLSQIAGVVRNWRATIRIDLEHPGRSSVEVVMDAGSLDTLDQSRDEHIRSAEFLDAGAHPDIRFRSRHVNLIDAARSDIVGDLTIRGVTRAVTLALVDKGRTRDGKGRERAAFHAHATINRQDFGLRWNQDLDTGGVVVGDKIDVEIEVNAIAYAQPPEVPDAARPAGARVEQGDPT